jgi:hypothetical protein
MRGPAGLWVFGEEGVEHLWCRSMKSEEVELVQRLFPESEITELHGGSKDPPDWFLKSGTPR